MFIFLIIYRFSGRWQYRLDLWNTRFEILFCFGASRQREIWFSSTSWTDYPLWRRNDRWFDCSCFSNAIVLYIFIHILDKHFFNLWQGVVNTLFYTILLSPCINVAFGVLQSSTTLIWVKGAFCQYEVEIQLFATIFVTNCSKNKPHF